MEYRIDNKKVPQILSLAAGRVEEWVTHSWKWLNLIREVLIHRVYKEQRISTRTLRIDQRLAIQKLLKVLISHIDLKSLCVGYYHSETGVFIHLGLEYLAKKAGLNNRRAQRALKWLYEAGYIIGQRRSIIDEDTGEYIHKTSIRRISLRLFYDLGITELALNRARQRTKKKVEHLILQTLKPLQSLNERTTKNNSSKILEIITELTQSLSDTKLRHKQNLSKDYLEKIDKLRKAFPNKSVYEIQQMLPRP